MILTIVFYHFLKEQKKQIADSPVEPEPVTTPTTKPNKNLNPKQRKGENKTKSKQVQRVSESEFVSDTLQTNPADLDEVKEGMKKLGIDSLAKQALETNKNGKIVKETN